MLLKVKYISTSPIRNSRGHAAPHPIEEGQQVKDEKILDEAIDVDRIKGIRPFHGNRYSKHGKVAVVYLKPDTFKEKAKEMHVLADWEELTEKVNELKAGARKEEKAT